MNSNESLPPPTAITLYDKNKRGYIGKLGHGANADIVFLQTAITKPELDSITLIQNIPGSSKWPVRDLFQRDVDAERVGESLLPYLQDTGQVKFFSPLTLVVLPMDDGKEQILRDLTVAKVSETTEHNHSYQVSEREQYFRFKKHIADPAFSVVEWNSQKVRLVAVDGQHRLSAFKRWKETPGELESDFDDWLIPVVILGVFKVDDDQDAAELLDTIRAIFVNINSRAERVNEAREILLNDESTNAICAQEVVECAHANDCKTLSERDRTRVPLIFFDWRGDVKNGFRVPTPGALKSVEEIRDWFEVYILGGDGSDDQSNAIGLDDLIPLLTSFGELKRLSHADSQRIRKHVSEDLVPAFLAVLERFQPYKEYIESARQIENDNFEVGPELSRHAFDWIRFGSWKYDQTIEDGVKARRTNILTDYQEARDESGLGDTSLVRRDIGMRAVMCAYGYGKENFDNAIGRTSTWTEYAEWFVDGVNAVYEDRWFDSYDDIDIEGRELLTQVVFDAAGGIVNYKLEAQLRGFGALLLILIFCKYGNDDPLGDKASEAAEASWAEHAGDLEATIKSGYRRTFLSALRDFGTPEQIRVEAAKRAASAATKHMDKIESFVSG